jgi:hypothetical protein
MTDTDILAGFLIVVCTTVALIALVWYDQR